MKKVFRKTAGILIILLLLSLLLSACGEKDVSGSYRASCNMKDILNKDLEAAGVKLNSDVNTDVFLELKDDSSFTLDIDAAGLRERFTEVIRSEGRGIIDAMLEEQGISEDMHDMIASTSGYDTYEAFVDSMIGMILDEMNDKSVQELETASHSEGTYSVKKNRLMLTGPEDGIKEGTIGEAGSIAIVFEMDDGAALDLLFEIQQ